MLPPVKGSTQQYLANLDRIQSSMDDIQRQISSGLRVQRPSDDPSSVAAIYDTQTSIALANQAQSNLGQAQSELQTGDAALQQALQAVESAISAASRSSDPLANGAQHAALVEQVKSVLETLVNLSATTSGGRYIFSGDLDQQALYALDASQPTGVKQLATTQSTRAVVDANGATVWVGKTASEIFDLRNPDNTPASGNVFAAVNSLLTALQDNDQAGALSSIDSLKAADEHLNQVLGLYGVGENRVTDALNASSSALVSDKQTLSNLRDTDVAAAAVQLSQLTVEQQAALTSRSKTLGQNLFDYLA